jgi:hypothetical protein
MFNEVEEVIHKMVVRIKEEAEAVMQTEMAGDKTMRRPQ